MRSPERSRLRRLLAAPLLHFCVLGGLLYITMGFLESTDSAIQVFVDRDEIVAAETEWERAMGRPPNTTERDGLIEARIKDGLLLAEARALGWHETDAIVQRRLIKNQRFLEVDPSADDAALLERAYAEGMDRSDVVVQRRLRERLKLMITHAARTPEPSREALQRYLDGHAAQYTIPPRTRLTHVFVSRDRRSSTVQSDAEEILAALGDTPPSPGTSGRMGDPILLSRDLPLLSETMLARQLGTEFAAHAIHAPLTRWSGPIPSSYGLHLVWVHEAEPSRPATLPEVEKAVRAEILREREEAALTRFLSNSRARADIQIEDTPRTLAE
jgi:hypothetical protein